MQIVGDAGEGMPDPRLAAFEHLRTLAVPAITFVPQPTVENALPGYQTGSDQSGLLEMSVSFTYTLIRKSHDREAPENLRELDEDTQRALEQLPYRNRPAWVSEMAAWGRYPQLREAVRTSWSRVEDELSTVDAALLQHVNDVLRNHFHAERGWGGPTGSMDPAPDVTAAAIQHDAHLVVDGETLDGIRINTDPHVYALGARVPSGAILTVVVPRDELDYLTLEFQTYAAEFSDGPAPSAPLIPPPRRTSSAAPTMPANPWPHDMVISVNEDSDVFLELLWIREAWRLNLAGDDLPPLLADTPTAIAESMRAGAPIADWQDAWPGIWRACLVHAGTPRDPAAFERMSSASPGSERAALIKEMIGPSWDDLFGRDALTEQYQRWQRMLHERRGARTMRTAGDAPEQIALDALIPAWRAGLTTIVQIPCRGTYTRVIGPHTLLVTAETRALPDSYRSALAAFR